jgi:hypothetical protein
MVGFCLGRKMLISGSTATLCSMAPAYGSLRLSNAGNQNESPEKVESLGAMVEYLMQMRATWSEKEGRGIRRRIIRFHTVGEGGEHALVGYPPYVELPPPSKALGRRQTWLLMPRFSVAMRSDHRGGRPSCLVGLHARQLPRFPPARSALCAS